VNLGGPRRPLANRSTARRSPPTDPPYQEREPVSTESQEPHGPSPLTNVYSVRRHAGFAVLSYAPL